MSLSRARDLSDISFSLRQETKLQLQHWQAELRELRIPSTGLEQRVTDLQAKIRDQESLLQAAALELSQFGKHRSPEHHQPVQQLQLSFQQLQDGLKSDKTCFRKLQLLAKRTAEESKRTQIRASTESQESDNVQEAAKLPRSLHGRLNARQQAVLESSDSVTNALQRTHQLMHAELHRSKYAEETLARSTNDLQRLSEHYSGLDNLLQASRSLVNTLARSNKSDTWYLETAFLVLAVSIGWLLFRRLLYGPGYWFIYYPLRVSLSEIFFRCQIYSFWRAWTGLR